MFKKKKAVDPRREQVIKILKAIPPAYWKSSTSIGLYITKYNDADIEIGEMGELIINGIYIYHGLPEVTELYKEVRRYRYEERCREARKTLDDFLDKSV